ncbi:type VI secretion system domain-containing protein [Methylobacterium persicinum]
MGRDAAAPARERARARALEWFADRSATLCEQGPDEDEDEAVLYAYQMLGEIEELAGDRQPKFRPEFGHLSRALRVHVEAIRAAHRERERREAEEAAALAASLPTDEEAHRVAEAAPAAVPDASRPAPAPGNAAFDPAAVGHLPETLRDWSAGLLAGNTADSLAYALSRVASWGRLHRLPPHAGGRTVAMPPAAEAEAVRALIAAGRKLEALQALEAMVWTAPFWFEGHRLSARTLGEMGADYADAQAMVGGMVSLLLRRFPDLADFAFADGSPFIGPETRDWLAEMGSAPAGGPVDALDRTQAEARSLVAAGRGQEAVKLLAGMTKGDVTGRNRFVRQILQVRLCLDMGLIATAIPLLDHMDQLLDAHALEIWEPALAAEVAELRVRALTHAEAPRLIAEDRRRTSLEAARRRLAGLDLATASHLFR